MAAVNLEEMKNYLRVDYDDDDNLIAALIESAQKLCMDTARADDDEKFEAEKNAKIAVMYATAYLYEHREDADHHALALTLRSLLFAAREGVF